MSLRPLLLRSSLSPSFTCPRLPCTRTVRTTFSSGSLVGRGVWCTLGFGGGRGEALGLPAGRRRLPTCSSRCLSSSFSPCLYFRVRSNFTVDARCFRCSEVLFVDLRNYLHCLRPNAVVMTSVLETQQDAAFNSFFRAADSSEEVAEGRRRRFAQTLEFFPLEIFMVTVDAKCCRCAEVLSQIITVDATRFRCAEVLSLLAPNAAVARKTCPRSSLLTPNA